MDPPKYIASKSEDSNPHVTLPHSSKTICCPYHNHLKKTTETFLYEHLKHCGWTQEQITALDEHFADAKSQDCIFFNEEDSGEEMDYNLQQKLHSELQQRFRIAKEICATQPQDGESINDWQWLNTEITKGG
ncbi:hypothetical protein DV736_g2288, partial [Chaetothyriales sp. CBS 134916]